MRRGWCGLGSIRSSEMLPEVSCEISSGASADAAGVRVGRSASRPLPSALRGFSVLFMGQNLFCKLDITFGAFGAGIVGQDRFAEARGLGEPDAAGYYSVKDLILEELPEVGRDLARQVRAT